MSRPLILLFALLLATTAHAAVHLPTGEFRHSVEDLRVKVRHGHVVIARTWQADDLNRGQFRWHANPAWDDLTFTMDVIDGVPRTIHRAGARFERSGNDVYVFDRQYFIRAMTNEDDELLGWRWSDRLGNVITYAADGRIASYGNRHGTTVTFVRDGSGRITSLRDADDTLLLTYHWTGDDPPVEFDPRDIKCSSHAPTLRVYRRQGEGIRRLNVMALGSTANQPG